MGVGWRYVRLLLTKETSRPWSLQLPCAAPVCRSRTAGD